MIIGKELLNEIQIKNLNDSIEAYKNRELISGYSPPVVFLELTRNCISQCVYCRKKWINSPEFDMSPKIFNIIIKEIAPYTALIDLRSYGESLMLKNFRWYLEKIGNICRRLRITTTLGCGDKDTLLSLVEYNVSVSVSFDAANKELYERYRRGISYDVVINNLRFLSSEMLKKFGTLKNHIRIGIAPLYGENLDYVDSVIELAKELYIPEIRILQLSSNWYDLNTLFFHQKKLIYTLKKAIEKADKYGIEIQFGSPLISSLKIKEKACELCIKPWLYAVIMFDGTMRYCDWQIELKKKQDDFGNIKDGVAKIWNGEIAQKIRKKHLLGKNRSKICNTCYRIGRYSDHEHNIDTFFSKWLVTGNDVIKKINIFTS